MGLKAQCEAATSRSLRDLQADVGFGAVTREDDAYMLGGAALARASVHPDLQRPLVEGKRIRDWRVVDPDAALWPYAGPRLTAHIDQQGAKLLWPLRSVLARRVAYGDTQIERGLEWFEYSMFFRLRLTGDVRIVLPTVATHVHAAIDSVGGVYKDTAVVLTLPGGATSASWLKSSDGWLC